MKFLCQRIRKQWSVYKEGTSLTPEEAKDMLDHINQCAECREFAYTYAHSSLLKDSYGGSPPPPSEYFFSKLEHNLKDIPHQTQRSTFTDILLQKGWKLVPIMIVLILFLAASVMYQYNNLSQMNPLLTPFDETVIFEDTPLDSNFVLSAVLIEDLSNGTQNY